MAGPVIDTGANGALSNKVATVSTQFLRDVWSISKLKSCRNGCKLVSNDSRPLSDDSNNKHVMKYPISLQQEKRELIWSLGHACVLWVELSWSQPLLPLNPESYNMYEYGLYLSQPQFSFVYFMRLNPKSSYWCSVIINLFLCLNTFLCLWLIISW